MDIAYVKNGYLYHTEFDAQQYIPEGSLQRAGENVLATLKTLANSPCINLPCSSQDYKIVFFDVLGFFVVQYPLNFAILLNLFTCVLIILKVFRQFQTAEESFGNNYTNDIDDNKYNFHNSSSLNGYSVRNFIYHIGIHVISLICTVVSTFILTKLVVFLGLTMCWYNIPILMVPIYIVPLVLIGYCVHLLLPQYFTLFQVLSISFSYTVYR